MSSKLPSRYLGLLEALKARVARSRIEASRKVNRELIQLYHFIGSEILKEQEEKGWGAKVVDQLSKDLSSSFPEMKGFSPANLRNMRKFAQLYPDVTILQQAAGELPWYHHVVLMEKIKDSKERDFYIKKTIENGWSRSVLIHQVESNLYQRQGRAITNFKEKLPPPQSDLAQQTLKDPYIFDFLNLSEEASERDLETSMIRHMEKFLLELGAGFAFVGRQYHLEVGGEDFYLDLLFYHFKLRCFIAIELKIDNFKPEYSGKMNFYLSALDSKLKAPEDNPSIGLILCKTKNEVLAEYALRDMAKPIGLAEYRLTQALPEDIRGSLPSIEDLEAELAGEAK